MIIMNQINRVAVLGSGIMGAGIAAHLANCGIPSLMLDIVTPNLSGEEAKNPKRRNALVEKSKVALLKSKPAQLYKKSNVHMIETGNFEDDMARIADCDWIIEVVVERLDIKRQVYAQVAQHRRPGTIVTSNTSGIPISTMAADMDEEMRQHFMGTHFFNPPRYLKLLELIPGAETLPEVIDAIADIGENVLGKGIVYAKDTPNFIANRLIIFATQYIMHSMMESGLTVEEVDALTGPAIGHASSASFRTLDLVGLDTMQKVVGNVRDGCPNDERLDMMSGPEWFDRMVEKGYLGGKSGSGFYKKTEERDEKGRRIIQGLDLKTLEYRPPVKPRFACTGTVRGVSDLDEKLRIMHFGDDPGSKWLLRFFLHLAHYTAMRVPEIADDLVNIDNAMKWGFAWEVGVFETWDILGFEKVCEGMVAEGLTLPPIAAALKEAGESSFYKTTQGKRHHFDLSSKSYLPIVESEKEVVLAHVKAASENHTVEQNDGASLIDVGDGIVCCEFHSKMNAIDGDLVIMLNKGVDLLEEGKFDGMIVANQGPHFSAGANLFLVLGAAAQKDWKAVETMVDELQKVGMRMKYCGAPVVAAPHHYTFGGGLEVCLHADKVVIAGETYAGLVEAGVGVIPAGGGTKEHLVRALEYIPETAINADPFPYARRAFETIAMAKVGTSGAEVIELGHLRNTDIVEPNAEHLVGRAKTVCLGMLKMGYRPPLPPRLWALGESTEAAFRSAVWSMGEAGWASEHDIVIAGKLAYILCGGGHMAGTPITEQDLLDLEREAFLSLCGMEKTHARIQYMLENNKPLRN
jgi:3-hydroxyacyl-CoA dehydrogenase